MCQLFESIKIKDGKAFHVDLHQNRMDRSIREIFGVSNKLNISSILKEQQIPQQGLFKCRIVYDKELIAVEILPYTKKKINTLRIVRCDELEYQHKYSNREVLNSLVKQNSDVDEIIILKNELITDSTYSNLVFWNGAQWHTPEKPLLKGIQREFLISEKKISSTEIRIQDLKNYTKVGLINAMMNLEEMPVIEISKIDLGLSAKY